ncbi:MAG: hypothetical protein HC919_12950 [Oscillatoriales cyanobacterium SM2_2_1]|nr:hypothetical protein [Oscillatoriales cyanobacterium SM2_2_1]
MQIEVPNDYQIVDEALQILIKEMEPWKVARFIATCNLGRGDYQKIRDALFAGETLDSLIAKITTYDHSKPQANLE